MEANYLRENQMKNNIPRIAVLLSTYNGEKFLDQQLYTLNCQKDVNITLFVRDDNSKDKTLDILKKWSDKIEIKLIKSSKNLGPAKSFWKLVKSVGLDFDYYALCDQDDLWDKDKLITACINMKDINEACLYFCAERTINSDNKVLDDGTGDKIILTLESEIVCGYCPGCALVVNTPLMRIIQGQNYKNLPMHDIVFIWTAFALGKVIYDPNPHFSRRVHANNVVARKGKGRITLLKNYVKKICKKNNCPLDDFTKEFLESINEKDTVKIDLKSLETLAEYKKIKNRFKILKDSRYVSSNRRGLLSFRIQLLLGKL